MQRTPKHPSASKAAFQEVSLQEDIEPNQQGLNKPSSVLGLVTGALKPAASKPYCGTHSLNVWLAPRFSRDSYSSSEGCDGGPLCSHSKACQALQYS
jgi:hypothetical protein